MPPSSPLERDTVAMELDNICIDLEMQLLSTPKGYGPSVPGVSALERAVRARLEEMDMPLTSKQAVDVHRRCEDPFWLPSVLTAFAEVLGESAPDFGRRLLKDSFYGEPSVSPVTPRQRTPTSTQGPSTPLSTRKSRTRASMLSIKKFEDAWETSLMHQAVEKLKASWTKYFTRLAHGQTWSVETLEQAIKDAQVFEGLIPGPMRDRALKLAGDAGLDKKGALRALTFIALHGQKGVTRLSQIELPRAMDRRMCDAVMILALQTPVRSSKGQGVSSESTVPAVPGIPDILQSTPGQAQDDVDDAERAADERLANTLSLPLSQSVGAVLKSSTERERRERERNGQKTAPFAQEKGPADEVLMSSGERQRLERKQREETGPMKSTDERERYERKQREDTRPKTNPSALPLVQGRTVADEVGILRKELHGLRRQLEARFPQQSQKRWGVLPLAVAAVGSVGVGLIALVTAEMLGALGDSVPFVPYDFRAFV